MKEYTCIWRIQVDGGTPREAAEAARAIMVDGEALMFEVFQFPDKDPGELEGCVYVDLNVGEDDDS